MILTSKEFVSRYKNNSLKIAFIGMSNIGKSYTAKRLQSAYTFDVIEIDDLIIKELGKTSMAEFAAWQGQPYEPGYAKRETRSVELETNAVAKALSMTQKNTLIDTPGSVIYTNPKVLGKLKRECLIVYIRAQVTDIDRLKNDYFENPKPLIWRGHYKPKTSLNDFENVMNCFPNLLQSRSEAYADLADVTLDADFIIDPNTSPQDLFEAIKPSETNPTPIADAFSPV